MRVFVAGASGAIGTPARSPVDRRRPRGGRHPQLAGATPSCSARSARSRSRSTCSTRARCAGPCSRPSPRRSCTRRPRLRTCEVRPQPGPAFAADEPSCGPRAPTRCWPPRARRACAASSRRASPPLPVRPRRAGRSRPRTIRSIPTPPPQRPQSYAAMRLSRRRRSPTPAGSRSATAASTARPTTGWIEPVRKRQFPIVGDGGGVISFIHLDDAAAATVLALEHDGPAIYNIVDDEPGARARVAAGARRGPRRQAAAALPALARAAGRRRGGGDDGHRGARRVEREGQARARLDAALPELADGLPGPPTRRTVAD